MQAILAIFVIFLLMAVSPLLGALFGAFSGWVVGLFFGDTLLSIFSQLGVHASMWAIGAFLGFGGGFFRSHLTTNNK